MSTRSFRLSIAKWASLADEQLDAVARQVCFETAKRVVENTPVDTGFLRGSWQPSIGAPEIKGEGEAAVDPGGALALTQIGLTIAGMKAGETFYMTNGCVYARFVEFGTSKMEGRRYVQKTVKAWRGIVADVMRDLGLAA